MVSFRTKSVQALLVVLAVEREPQRRETLIELLWPGLPPESGRKNLRQALYELRKAIPEAGGRDGPGEVPLVVADRQTIQLNPQAKVEVDVMTFEDLIRWPSLVRLQQAVELYRGDFLVDFYLPDSAPFEEWVAGRRAYLRRQALDALERLANQAIEGGDYRRAEEYAWRQLALDELREPAIRQLMVALTRQGKRSQALSQYETSQGRLWAELGAEPAAETAALYEQILADELRQEEPQRPVPLEPSPEAESVSRPHNLPSEPTPFIGRAADLEAVMVRLLSPECRLLTLLGPGGSGKTRLALAVARQLLDRHLNPAALASGQAQASAFADGIWYMSITGPGPADVIATHLSSTLDFQSFSSDADPWPRLLGHLRQRKMLLIFDNFEYMVQGGESPGTGREAGPAQRIVELLKQAPEVKVLVCSRARLNVHAEQLYPVEGLPTPDEAEAEGWTEPLSEAQTYDAVQLFLQSARRSRPDFALTADNLAPALDICRRLQGMPLAIELAAAWIELLSPGEILAEIEHSLDFLESDWRDLPDRQRSLRAVFGTSWRLLSEQERAAYRRLAVFRGGFDRLAAEQVAGASVRVLLGLVNKSWLQRGANSRFTSHELLRQYAYELLSLEPEVWREAHAAHAAFYAGFMEQQWARTKTADQQAATEALDQEFDNVVAAWRWLVEQREIASLVETILPGLFFYCGLRYKGQAIIPMLEAVLAALDEMDGETGRRCRAILLTARAAFVFNYLAIRFLGLDSVDLPTPLEKIQAAWVLAEWPGVDRAMGIWFPILATLYGWRFFGSSSLSLAAQRLRALLPAYEASGDPWLLAFALENLGHILLPEAGSGAKDTELQAEARQSLSRAVTLFESLGDQRERGYALRLLGQLLAWQKEYDDAARSLLAAQEALEMAGEKVLRSVGGYLSDIYLEQGKFEEAFAVLREARRQAADLGKQFEAYVLSKESLAASRFGTLEHARETRIESLALAEASGDRHTAAWGLWELGEIERLAGNLEEARRLYADARLRFEEYDHLVGLAFYYRGMGDLALAQAQYGEAGKNFEESRQIAAQANFLWGQVYALAGLGWAALYQGQIDQAREHFLAALKRHYSVDPGLAMVPLAGLAAAFAADGQPEKAVELSAFVLNQHSSWQETRWRAEATQRKAASELPESIVESARQKGRAAEFQAVVAGLLETAAEP